MRYRLLGTSGLRVSEAFLGAMTWGEQGGVGAAPEECRQMLDAYTEAGGNSDAPAWIVSRANALAQWRGWSPFVGLQVPYSLLMRDIERELLPMAQARDERRGLVPAGRRGTVRQVHPARGTGGWNPPRPGDPRRP